MKIIIIEDELPAIDKLERYLYKFDPEMQIVFKGHDIESSVEWITHHQSEIDLIFMDVQLLDGLGFEIFSKVEVVKPIIFTTAYDEYAIDAFKVNSLDYILKPMTYTDLSNSLKKLDTIRSNWSSSLLKGSLNLHASKRHKERFMVKKGNHIHTISTSEIAFFYAEGRTVYLVDTERRKYIIDFRLEDLEQILDAGIFFRINRGMIIHIDSIEDVMVYSSSRFLIKTKVPFDKDVVVSRDRVPEFKDWLRGKI